MVHRFMDSTDSDDNSEDDADLDDDDILKSLTVVRAAQNNLFSTALLAANYYMTYFDKNEPRIFGQSGYSWMMDVLRTGGSHKMFRMDATLFYKLHNLLVTSYGLQSSIHMSSMESLALFLTILGQGWSFSGLTNVFKHSNETMSRKFEEILNCVVAMAKEYIKPLDPNFSTTHTRISSDSRMMPYFKDCIGALDGTHISATPPPKDLIRFIGRSGKPTQNVMAVVDFDLRFTYASIGQPGSMHDTNVLFHALEQDRENFPHPPLGMNYKILS
jgi:hypothetical protein